MRRAPAQLPLADTLRLITPAFPPHGDAYLAWSPRSLAVPEPPPIHWALRSPPRTMNGVTYVEWSAAQLARLRGHEGKVCHVILPAPLTVPVSQFLIV